MSISVIKNQPSVTSHRMTAILQVVLASCFIGLCAQIKIPLYFTPVPLTLGNIGVMSIGALLGSRKGALAVLCYLIQGWVGLPVWAGGEAGIAYFLGPTGGYLIGYVVQAYCIGVFLEKQDHPKNIFGVFMMSICLQLVLGSLWLAQFVGIKQCLNLGFYPFIVGDAFKGLLVALYIEFYNKLKKGGETWKLRLRKEIR